MDVQVYFKPDCTTCQTVDGMLQERGIDATYVRYLDQAPTRDQLEAVMAKLGATDPRDMIRTKEPEYEELGLATASADEVLDAMVANPILIQRPIVIAGDRAVIARPPDRMLELIDN